MTLARLLDTIKPGLPPWGPHVRFRRVQTLVREGIPLVKLRTTATLTLSKRSMSIITAIHCRRIVVLGVTVIAGVVLDVTVIVVLVAAVIDIDQRGGDRLDGTGGAVTAGAIVWLAKSSAVGLALDIGYSAIHYEISDTGPGAFNFRLMLS